VKCESLLEREWQPLERDRKHTGDKHERAKSPSIDRVVGPGCFYHASMLTAREAKRCKHRHIAAFPRRSDARVVATW